MKLNKLKLSALLVCSAVSSFGALANTIIGEPVEAAVTVTVINDSTLTFVATPAENLTVSKAGQVGAKLASYTLTSDNKDDLLAVAIGNPIVDNTMCSKLAEEKEINNTLIACLDVTNNINPVVTDTARNLYFYKEDDIANKAIVTKTAQDVKPGSYTLTLYAINYAL
ncbi:hypothetical protein H9X98_22935 [Aeromonas jandaei]|uniref:hypothetical protein n=1 Tax=Aeromonas jandaei TaxID=650 RepID=UPI001F442582|nr:hypothetical protein [Aeromonas jandaei]MCF7720503.1 hypothetical protein [Aeromonas jandaei]